MKTLLRSLLLCAAWSWAALAGPAAAQASLAGTWQGKLEVAPGRTLDIHFVITATPGGGWSVIVTSPDEGAIKNVGAERVAFADGRLTLEVPKLSGSYAGTLRNGVLVGEWSQEGARLPLSLKPLGTRTLTKADIDTLRGDWSGPLSGQGVNVTIVLRFGTGPDGALRATFDVPEQGVKDWEARNVVLDDGHFSVELPGPSARITGQLAGDQIIGQWHQLGTAAPLTLKKGRHVAAAPTYLDLPADVRRQLAGRWSGTLNGLPVIVSFETDAQGRTQGTFDSTKQRMKFPISEARLAGNELTIAVSYGAKYTAKLAGDSITGEWTQPGLPKPLPLVLTREKEASAPAGK
jgi:hypothetical protein